MSKVNRIGVLINFRVLLCLLTIIMPSQLLSADRTYYTSAEKNRITHSWSYENDSFIYEENYGSENYAESVKKRHTGKKTRRNYSSSYNYNNGYTKRRYHKKRKERRTTVKRKRSVLKPKRRIKIKKRKKNTICYKIKRGDTLTKISKKYSIPVETIIKINRLKNRNRIKSGMIIKLAPNKRAKKRKKRHKKKNSPKKISPRFIWPVKGVVSYKRDGRKGVKPIGIIIKGKPGSPVISSAPGIVKKIGRMRGFGKYVIVKHDKRFITVYANLDRITVTRGDRIDRGEKIGKIKSNNSIFHFQIGHAGKPINPLKYLPGRKRHKM